MDHACRLGANADAAAHAAIYFIHERYADALDAAELATAVSPRYPFLRALAAATAFWLGQLFVRKDVYHT
jgi:hypothetical protein